MPSLWTTSQKVIAGLVVAITGIVLLTVAAVGLRQVTTGALDRKPTVEAVPNIQPLVIHQDADIPSDLFAHPADPGQLVDRTTAETAMGVLWPTRAQALATQDLATLERTDSHELQAVETFMAPDPSDPTPMSAGATWRLAAPPESTYPAYFVAEVRYQASNGAMRNDFLAVMRDGPDASWRFAMATSTVLDSWYLAPTDDATMATPLDALAFDYHDSRRIPATLAAYLQSWNSTGGPPAIDAPGSPFLDDAGAQVLGQHIAKNAADRRARGVSTAVYYDAGDGIPVFEVAVGQDLLVCGTVVWTGQHDSVPPGGVITQSGPGIEWGGNLAPGRYSHVTHSGAHQSCFLTNGHRFRTFGISSGYSEMRGIPQP